MLAYQSTQQVSLLGGGASIVIYIVIFVFVHIPSLTILYIVNVSTVSLFQRNIAYHALPVSGPLENVNHFIPSGLPRCFPHVQSPQRRL